MSTKFPQPWYRPSRGVWYVTLDGRQHNLGADKDQAFERYHQLMGMGPEQRLVGTTVAEVLDAFLDWCKLHRASRTYDWYRRQLQLFLNFLPRGLHVEQMKPYHLQRWIDSHASWSSGGKRNACTAIKAAFNWAVRQGYIERSPIRHFQKPAAGKRDRIITDAEFKSILASTRDHAFRDLLQLAWETGARPQELLRVRTCHVDIPNRRWVFPPNEAKGGRLPRIIYLNDVALALTLKWMRRYPNGVMLRNTHGKPWAPMAVGCRFYTIKHKLKKRYCLYNFRHTWATKALQKGLDPITVSQLMGHTDTNMLARTYAHLAHDPQYMQQAAARVTA